MDRNTFLAITLCFLIYAGWQKFFIEPHMRPDGSAITQPANSAGSAPINPPANSMMMMKRSDTQVAPRLALTHPPKKLLIQTGTGQATLGDSGFVFTDWLLKSYKLGITPEAASVDLQSVTHQPGQLSLSFDDSSLVYINEVQGDLAATDHGATWKYEDKNIKIFREVTASPDNPATHLTFKAEFKGTAPKYAFISLSQQAPEKDPEAQDRSLFYWTNKSIERVLLKDSIATQGIGTPVRYIGTSNRYFILTAIADSPIEPNALVQSTGQNAGRISLVYPISGNSINIPLRVYFGPKELSILTKVEPTLDHTVDFGWFTIFAYPLLTVLKLLYGFVKNYGVAIILLTLLLKVVTYPLTYKSMKSMKKMAKLQPQLQKIRDKYKDDKEALNREMLTLMKSHGYNPMAGCLPMIIQMPIFFALYRVLYGSIELYHAPFALWIQDLSIHDPFYVTPILLSITMFFQQKLTPNTATDPAQAKMMQFMPLIFGAFMLALPAGLTIYMLVNAIASIGQQMILNKKFDAVPAR